MENTVTGAIPPYAAAGTKTADADREIARKRDGKRKWITLSSATALIVALGVGLEEMAKLTEKITDLTEYFFTTPSEWSDDQQVVIVRRETLPKRTIKVCTDDRESGDTRHIALMPANSGDDLLPAFVLVRSGCATDEGLLRVQMNAEDFDRYITEKRTLDFELSYNKAHLHGLELLLEDAFEPCRVDVANNETKRGN